MLRLWEWSDLIRIVFDGANAPNFSEVLNFDLGDTLEQAGERAHFVRADILV